MLSPWNIYFATVTNCSTDLPGRNIFSAACLCEYSDATLLHIV
jgi:hypothetical protein